MPQQPTAPVSSGSPPDIHDDPEFHGLPMAEKHKVLMALDPDYRGLPPSEQAKALDEIHYGPAPQPSDPGMTGGGRERLADTIDKARSIPERALSSGLEAFGFSSTRDPDVISKFVGAKTGPSGKPALVDAIQAHADAGAKDPVGYTPVLGPMSVRASEHAHAHQWPEMVGDLGAAVATVAPFKGAGVKLADAAGAVVRDSSGAMRPTLKAASEVGGAVGGAAVMDKHPYIGAGIGYKAVPRILDKILPERAPAPFPKKFPDIPEAEPTPQPKPRMTAAEVKARGIQTGVVRDEAQTQSPPPKERLSAAMQRKVGEAEGRYDARRMAQTGALRDEDSRTGRNYSPESDEARPVSRKAQDSKTPGAKDSADRMSERTGTSRGQLEREQAEAERSATRTLRSNIAKSGGRLKDKVSGFEAGGKQRANEISPIDPREKAEIEQRVGRKLTDEEAYQERKKQGEWETNTRLKKGTVDTDLKMSTGLRDAQKKPGYGKGKSGEPALKDLIQGDVEKQVRFKSAKKSSFESGGYKPQYNKEGEEVFHPADPVSGGPLHSMLDGIPKPTMPHQELMVRYGLEAANEGGLTWWKGPKQEIAPNIRHIQFSVSGEWQAVGTARDGSMKAIATGRSVRSLERILKTGIPRDTATGIFDKPSKAMAEGKRESQRMLRKHVREGGKINKPGAEKHGDLREAMARQESFDTVAEFVKNDSMTHHQIAEGLNAPPNEILKTLYDMRAEGKAQFSRGKWSIGKAKK